MFRCPLLVEFRIFPSCHFSPWYKANQYCRSLKLRCAAVRQWHMNTMSAITCQEMYVNADRTAWYMRLHTTRILHGMHLLWLSACSHNLHNPGNLYMCLHFLRLLQIVACIMKTAFCMESCDFLVLCIPLH